MPKAPKLAKPTLAPGAVFQARGLAAQKHRASLARAWRRRDRGDVPEICSHCKTEVDVDQVAHDVRCPAFVLEVAA